MMKMLSRRHSLILATTGWLATAAAQGSDPGRPIARRAPSQAEIARQLSVPAPPDGVIDVQWRNLAPAGWTPFIAVARVGLDKLHANDPRGPERMDKVRKEWDRSPTVTHYEGKRARLTGFAQVLNADEGANAIVLFPYDIQSSQAPPPPANQMVVVVLQGTLAREMAGRPIWVTGTLRVQKVSTPFGLAAYSMQGAQWSPYPQREHPIPPYSLRW